MPYCAAPFNSVRVDSTGTRQAIYKPCCLYEQKDSYSSILEYVQSTELHSLQQHFSTKIDFPKSCNSCQFQEEQGQVSLRHHFNSKFNNTQKITTLEIFPGNVCNLKCFMCDSNYSTALASEQKTLNFIDSYKEIDNVDVCMDAISSLPDLTNVSFIGGEFFLTKKNIEILDLLIQRQIKANIFTNGTVILREHIERLKKLPELEIVVSIDGVSDSYEFMRYPAKWKTVNSNILHIKKELTNAKLQFIFVVQPLNIQYMIPMLDYANRLIIPTQLTNLVNPTWLTWKVLTDHEKQHIIETLHQQQLEFKLTVQQKKQVSDYQQTLKNAVFDADLREVFKTRLNKILYHRGLSSEAIEKHLGKLSSLLR